MIKPWQDLEGTYFRVDVGTSTEEAINGTVSDAAGYIFFTTDNDIVMNGEKFGGGLYNMGDVSTWSEVLAAINAITGDLTKPVATITQNGGKYSGVLIQTIVDGTLMRQTFYWGNAVMGRDVWFTDTTHTTISQTGNFARNFCDRLKWDASLNKLVPYQFANADEYRLDASKTDAIPTATADNDGLMSKDAYATLTDLQSRVAELEASLSLVSKNTAAASDEAEAAAD